eukprot:TRINITY_DN5083_c0_g1_i3.p1 TRINITY_DN5083_c0_g1~~TRINITY_DN5083_c0_g1_i3.p1  ORF type:complete len:385 (+),score=47.77 TRINITY_DN5083_c0_g1_i3:815-1969(+)
MKADTKTCLGKYILSLYDHAEGQHIFINSSPFTMRHRDDWLAKWSKTQFHDVDLVHHTLHDRSQDIEQLIHSMIVGKHNSFPPSIPSNSFKYIGTGTSRPDCAERGIRGLINIAIFDIDKQQFDLERLEEMGASEELKRFFRIYCHNLGSVKSDSAGQAWFNFLAGRPKVLYLSSSDIGNYEVLPEDSNFLQIFCELFPRKMVVKEWARVAETLSTSQCHVRVSVEKDIARGAKARFQFQYPCGLQTRVYLKIVYKSHTHLIQETPIKQAATEGQLVPLLQNMNSLSRASYSPALVSFLLAGIHDPTNLIDVILKKAGTSIDLWWLLLFSLSWGKDLIKKFKRVGCHLKEENLLTKEHSQFLKTARRSLRSPYTNKPPTTEGSG